MASDNVYQQRLALVAGELSGDFLGTGLIQALRSLLPNFYCEGIAGPGMVASGCIAVANIDRLAVMGVVEVVTRLPELLRLRRRLAHRWVAWRPDAFIGIDAPDFNLELERRLRRAGIPTVHYVSPSVWAWRSWRVRKIAQAADLVLTLFPFEEEFYTRHGIKARFVGHPLADAIPFQSDSLAARNALGLYPPGEIIALLPGSRSSEVEYLAGDFLRAAEWISAHRPGLRFILPLAGPHLRPILNRALHKVKQKFALWIFEGRARECIAAADAVLLSSGTAALETLLIGRPMVIAYRLAPLTYQLVKPLMTVDYYSLPNHLLGRVAVPELIQDAATPLALGRAVLDCLEYPERNTALLAEFNLIHRRLRRNANHQAATAIHELLERRYSAQSYCPQATKINETANVG